MADTVFVVRRTAEQEYPLDGIPDPADQYAATFADRPAAEAHARHLDAEAKRTLDLTEYNPFANTLYDGLTTLPPPVLRDWLMDADIDPPPPVVGKKEAGPREQDVWRRWWEATAAGLSEVQRERLWAGLNKHSLYQVTEVATEAAAEAEPSAVVFAVVHHRWEYDDCFYCGANDTLKVYRTRAAAEAAARRLAADGAEVREYWNGGPNEYVVVELPYEPEG